MGDGEGDRLFWLTLCELFSFRFARGAGEWVDEATDSPSASFLFSVYLCGRSEQEGGEAAGGSG
jgi:hypothetical protein